MAAHVDEALYALYLCVCRGSRGRLFSAPVTAAWMVQTLILNFPSLALLLTRVNARAKAARAKEV